MTPTVAAIIWVIGIVAWTAIRWPHRRKARKTKVVADRKSTSEQIALGLCIVGLVAVPAAQLATGFLSFADYTFVPMLGYLGAVSMISFLAMFHLSHKHLARNWSVTLEIRKDHKLVSTGVYSRIRHPMYTSFWLWGIAQLLLIPNWIAGTAGVLSVAWLYFSRINQEEAMMQAQFGEEYTNYCKRTGRLVPKLG